MLGGFPVDGFMPSDARDELGDIPDDVATHLRRFPVRGYGPRTLGNIEIAHAVLAIVEDRTNPYATPGTRLTLHAARRRKLPTLAIDGETPIAIVRQFVAPMLTAHPLPRIMVAGPRASKWADGEATARRIVVALALYA